jgi:uncharacterized protein (TIGR03086 family)
MDVLEALDRAVEAFRTRLVGVGASQWACPTPCEEWDVRFLVAHVVGGHRFGADVLSGSSADDALSALMSSSVLGDDPLGRHDEFADAQRRGFRRPGALDATVDHPAGGLSGVEFLAMRVFDVTVHAWDLARATGADERIDDQLAACALRAITAVDRGPGFGIVAVGASDEDDAPLARLLDFSGRRP